jgi:hypothetical protein
MKWCEVQGTVVFLTIMIAISIVAFVCGLLDLKALFATIIGESFVAYLGYWLLKGRITEVEEREELRLSTLIVKCFVSKEKEQVGFELRNDKKLTKVEVYALVKEIEYGRIGLPYIDGGVLIYHFAILYKDESVKFLLAGEPPKAPNDKSTYTQLNKITPMILNGHSHKVTLLVRCNELQREIRKNFHLRFKSWDEVEFFEIQT